MKFVYALAAASLVGLPAAAQELPKQMKWTSYGTDSSGYAQAIAIGNMLKEQGTRVAVLPGQTDIARMTPLKRGAADYCMCGVAAYFGTEGVTDFATPDWGPQPLRLILSKIDKSGHGFAVRASSDIETIADLEGRRVPLVRAADAVNVPLNAALAFGGLTRDDVESVVFAGFSESWDGLINGTVDVAFATTLTPKSAQLAASPDGIRWLPMPFDEQENWDRLHTVAPYLAQRVVTHASGLPEGESVETIAYPYPFLVTMSRQDADEVYALTRAAVENFDSYKDAAPGATGWALDVQDFKWVIPYHEGAVRYFREAGVWTDAAEAHNRKLIDRQNVIIAAWEAMDTSATGDAFAEAWMKARAEALTAAGLPVVFE